MVEPAKINLTDSINLAQEWSKNAPFCPACGPPQRVVFICFERECHPPGHNVYCLNCLEALKHNKAPAVRIYNSLNMILKQLTNLKERSDQLYFGATQRFSVYSNLIALVEAKLVR